MPLFECSACHAVENTACSNWAIRSCDKLPSLCSECDPEIKQWHGLFPRQDVKDFRRENPTAKMIGDPGYFK